MSTPAAAHVALAEALAKGAPPAGSLAVPVFGHGSLEVELCVPHAHDPQGPHDRDEVYVVARGTARFWDGERRRPVEPGSFLFVPAHRPHRFEDFSPDFAAWVLFFGPAAGSPAGVAELVARERVRDTVLRYAHLVDRGRIDEVAALFAEDGVLHANDLPPAAGRAAIRELLLGTQSRLAAETSRPLIRHHVTSLRVEVEGPDAAAAEAYFLAVTERGVDHWGRYRDRLVRDGERWLFRHRRVRTDGHAAGAWGGRTQRPS